MTQTTLSPEERAELKAKALKAEAIAPGAWEHDTEPGGGEYGSGPNTRSGYAAYMMMDDKGRRLFGSDGSEVAEIHEEGEDAWDENSRRVFDFLAAANPSGVLRLLDQVDALTARAEKAEQQVATYRQGVAKAFNALCPACRGNAELPDKASSSDWLALSPSKSEADQ